MSWKHIERLRARLRREEGTVFKDHGGRMRVALAYPNTYYVGMSSLALQILYRQLNMEPKVVCERVFWEGEGAPVLSVESQRAVREFHVWAFTISFELDYFNVTSMLRAAGVPALSAERLKYPGHYPLVIAGGPGISMNPEPMAPIFDAIFVGEAEEALPHLIGLLQEEVGGDREKVLDSLDTLPGVYVPSRFLSPPGARRVLRLWVRDMDRLQPFSSLYTPDTELGSKHLIEIARGCGRGCRFCLAGFVYRPPREQPVSRILDWASAAMDKSTDRSGIPSGIGLVSAAVSDHSGIDELALALQDKGVRLSISSMRSDPISIPMVRALASSGAQTLTIAPEAGSERLRRVISKTQREEDLLSAVALARSLDFAQLKMYFMIGHPSETDEDIQAIIDLTCKARNIFRRTMTINATPFVPKAHTPFQWTSMAPAGLLAERQHTLRRSLARYGVKVNADSPEWAEVQGVLARGDQRLAPVIATLRRPTPQGFRQALGAYGLEPESYLGERDPSSPMPWDVVESGVRPGYLRHEWQLAASEASGRPCPPAQTGQTAEGASEHSNSRQVCLTCGVCDIAAWDRQKT